MSDTSTRDVGNPTAQKQVTAREAPPLYGKGSFGFQRAKVLGTQITRTERVLLLFCISIMATAHALDNSVRIMYQFEATSHLQYQDKLGAINTVATLSAAVITPAFSRLADIFGRLETLCLCILLYVSGTVIQAMIPNIAGFCIGQVIWSVGFAGVIFVLDVIIADITPLKWRVLCFYLPTIPYLATWSTGSLGKVALGKFEWQWSFALSASAYTVCSLPLIFTFYIVQGRARQRVPWYIEIEGSPFKAYRFRIFRHLFWQLDTMGWFCFTIFVMVLFVPPSAIPLGLANVWASPAMICAIIIGVTSLILWIVAERAAPHPLFPLELLRDKKVWTALIMGFFYHLAFYVQQTYLYSSLIVNFDMSSLIAGGVVGLYSFTSTLAGILISFTIRTHGDLRWYFRLGAALCVAAFFVQVSHPGGNSRIDHGAIISSQVLLGIAGGLFPFPAMALIQAAKDHGHLSLLTGLYLTFCRLGGGIGQAVAGAVWINYLQPELQRRLQNYPRIGLQVYSDPTQFVKEHPWRYRQRSKVVSVYTDTLRYLCIGGVICCIVLCMLACMVRDTCLKNRQSLLMFHDNTELYRLGRRARKHTRDTGDFELREIPKLPEPVMPQLMSSRYPCIM